MAAEHRLVLTRLREHRERTVSALQDAFAHDDLDIEEFERRVTLAHTTDSSDELDHLTADLARRGADIELRPVQSPGLTVPGDVRPVLAIRGFLSATTRSGPWSVPRRLAIKAVMSSNVLDFREARFPPGVVDLDVRTFMSSVEIIVPPGLSVQTDGVAILGAFDDIHRAPQHPDPDAPLLRIHGTAILSAVEVRMRLPGESERQHRQRQRNERRAGLPGTIPDCAVHLTDGIRSSR